MSSVIDVTDRIYKILNVASVKATITGSIYKNARPVKIQEVETLSYIEIIPLTHSNLFIKNAVVNVNLYFPDIQGTSNSVGMNITHKAIELVFEAYSSTTDYFNIDI